jgi:hypothetical protein
VFVGDAEIMKMLASALGRHRHGDGRCGIGSWEAPGGGRCLRTADYVTGTDAHARGRPPRGLMLTILLARSLAQAERRH